MRCTSGCCSVNKKVPEGVATAKALGYSLHRWEARTQFVDDGQLPIDNNWIENQIRPFALGKDRTGCLPAACALVSARQPSCAGSSRGPLVFSAITGGTQTQHWRGGGVGRSLILLAFLFTSQTGIVASR